MDYINPFSMVPQASEFDTTSLLSAMQAQNKQNMANPFIQRAAQGQQMDLMKQAQEQGEFMSPQAQQARMTGYEKQTAENQAAARKAPIMADKDIAQAKADLKALPYLNDKIIAEAEQAAVKARGTPMAQFFSDMGSFHDALQKVPEQQRPAMYAFGIQKWQQEHPGVKLPESMQQYNPQNLAALRYAQIHTAEQEQKQILEKQKTDSAEKVAGINAGGHIQAARITADAHLQGIKEAQKAQEGKNPAAERVRLSRILNSKESKPDQIAEASAGLEGLALDDFNKNVIKNDAILKSAEMQSMLAQTPEAKAQAEAAYDARRNKLWSQQLVAWGTRVKVMKNGKIGTIPREQLTEAESQGWKKVK